MLQKCPTIVKVFNLKFSEAVGVRNLSSKLTKECDYPSLKLQAIETISVAVVDPLLLLMTPPFSTPSWWFDDKNVIIYYQGLIEPPWP